MSLGEQIKKARNRLGLSQQFVASKFEISRAAVAQWESGDTRPDHGKLVQLAELLEISLSELLADTQDEAFPAPSRNEQSELTTLWALLLPSERETFMNQIRQNALHNKEVLETHGGKQRSKPQTQPQERRQGLVFYGGVERRKDGKGKQNGKT